MTSPEAAFRMLGWTRDALCAHPAVLGLASAIIASVAIMVRLSAGARSEEELFGPAEPEDEAP